MPDEKLYYFFDRNTPVVAKTAKEARENKMKNIMIGVVIVFLSLLLTGCFSNVRTETKIEYILPPQEWIAECTNPSVSVMTNEGLLRGYFERGTALQECNARMLRLIDWRNEYKDNE